MKMKHSWKQVPIDTSKLDISELEHLGGIEELTDYKILRPGCVLSKKTKTKKLKQKKKRKLDSLDPDISTEKTEKRPKVEQLGGIEELTDYKILRPGCDISKKKNSKKLKQKKKRKLVSPDPDISTERAEERLKADMSAWDGFKIPPPVLSALEELRFLQPTEIQTLSIPAILSDKDVLGAAETGSGKTLAFGLPIIKNIMSIKESKKERGLDEKDLYCLILTPTRELAVQIKNHLQAVSKNTDILISVLVGGMAPEKQRRILKKCPDIVVATPGRLWEMIEEGEDHISKVPNVRYLVIDEADRMAEKGHFAELTQVLELINGNKDNRKIHRYVFSATLSMEVPHVKKKKHKLKSIIKLVGLKEPTIIDLTNKKAVAGTLIESQLVCRNEEKDSYLYYFLLMYPGRTLVFCNSIDCVRRLRSVLEYLNCNPLPLHASMHQRQRLKNLEKFEKSDTAVLLATDVAARGLDIKEIQHVIHYQVPRTAETYVHRSGRTARAKSEGLSLMMVEPQEAVFYKRISNALNKDHSLPTFPIDERAFKRIRERVKLARDVEKLEHRLKRLTSQNRWFENAAKEMDVDLEDNLLNDLSCETGEIRKLKSMKKQLKGMLQQNIKMFLSTLPGVQSAVEVLQKKPKKCNKICK